ncbi:MAG TPA: ABC transporter ATP-binding protein [Acidimicrobiales bacterium]|jgi:putative ABC transport system ATP-binding protein
MTTQVSAPPIAAARVADATKLYGRAPAIVRALDAISVTVREGRWLALMGPSGSGKSTLLHCMAGLDTLTSGYAEIGGHSLGDLDDDQLTMLRREHVGFVFQAFNLIPSLTAAQNLALPITLAGGRPDRSRVEAMLANVGLSGRARHRPSELSGGQQQRVAVARALITEPDVVFADEPTGNLDSQSSSDILALFRRAVDDLGQTVAMVTHDPVAAAHADEVVFLFDGRAVDHLEAPTADRVLARIKPLGG